MLKSRFFPYIRMTSKAGWLHNGSTCGGDGRNQSSRQNQGSFVQHRASLAKRDPGMRSQKTWFLEATKSYLGDDSWILSPSIDLCIYIYILFLDFLFQTWVNRSGFTGFFGWASRWNNGGEIIPAKKICCLLVSTFYHLYQKTKVIPSP